MKRKQGERQGKEVPLIWDFCVGEPGKNSTEKQGTEGWRSRFKVGYWDKGGRKEGGDIVGRKKSSRRKRIYKGESVEKMEIQVVSCSNRLSQKEGGTSETFSSDSKDVN